MPKLADTQQLLKRLISAPEGVAKALADAADRGAVGDALARTVRAHGRLGAVERLDIYANMYFFRLHDVLRDDYPALAAMLGADGFHNLITDYLLAHPPRHYSLRHAGERLAEFVAGHAASEAHPYLAELARLEAALLDAFDAADATPVPASALQRVPAAAWPEMRLRLHPSLRLLRGEWSVQHVRASVDRGQPPVAAAQTPTRLCVWRRELTVRQRELSELEFAALEQARAGRSFSELCAAAGDINPDSDLPRQLAGLLAGWVANGCIASLDTPA